MLSQFPTDDNNQEKVGKTEREEKEGEQGREINDQNRGRGGEDNKGKLWNKREKRKEEGEAIAVWEEDMGV